MIDRIILLKLNEGVARRQVAARARAALAGVPGLVSLDVGLPADAPSEKSWDVSLVLRFADLAALEAGLASDAFRAHHESELAAHCQVVKAWSFALV